MSRVLVAIAIVVHMVGVGGVVLALLNPDTSLRTILAAVVVAIAGAVWLSLAREALDQDRAHEVMLRGRHAPENGAPPAATPPPVRGVPVA